ncbi:hypothetical protein [Streptomyces lancefieldiae]|uniref:Uncharacterized protein n=1 Tax=Streptomyces lancefieldiae TaxID=3075520 RepID=A0ABU3AJW2_9ACTN|nr:hypothetical protein [Streptomyces sp. DSM 40712]MDT0609373.1 hypothetical protein [Streptomyces sp. DSM 40712]
MFPEKSLPAGWTKKVIPNPQVGELIASGAGTKVKCEETARDGPAVDVIEC